MDAILDADEPPPCLIGVLYYYYMLALTSSSEKALIGLALFYWRITGKKWSDASLSNTTYSDTKHAKSAATSMKPDVEIYCLHSIFRGSHRGVENSHFLVFQNRVAEGLLVRPHLSEVV